MMMMMMMMMTMDGPDPTREKKKNPRKSARVRPLVFPPNAPRGMKKKRKTL